MRIQIPTGLGFVSSSLADTTNLKRQTPNDGTEKLYGSVFIRTGPRATASLFKKVLKEAITRNPRKVGVWPTGGFRAGPRVLSTPKIPKAPND